MMKRTLPLSTATEVYLKYVGKRVCTMINPFSTGIIAFKIRQYVILNSCMPNNRRIYIYIYNSKENIQMKHNFLPK